MTWNPADNKIVVSPGVDDASETEICLKLMNVQGLQSNNSECFKFKLSVHDKLIPAEEEPKVEEILEKIVVEKVVEETVSINNLADLSIEEICANEEFRKSK
jgi:hypothetical protein